MATKWVSVTPSDYDLESLASSVERCTRVRLETGLRVQVLRMKPASLAEGTVKDALEQSETLSKALVVRGRRYVFAVLIHEE